MKMESCTDITLLIEKSKGKKLNWRERWQIKMHTKMCRFCENYNIDSKYLDGLLKRITPRSLHLTQEEKMRLTANVKERLN